MGIAEGKWAEGSGGGRSSWVSERKDGRQVSTEEDDDNFEVESAMLAPLAEIHDRDGSLRSGWLGGGQRLRKAAKRRRAVYAALAGFVVLMVAYASVGGLVSHRWSEANNMCEHLRADSTEGSSFREWRLWADAVSKVYLRNKVLALPDVASDPAVAEAAKECASQGWTTACTERVFQHNAKVVQELHEIEEDRKKLEQAYAAAVAAPGLLPQIQEIRIPAGLGLEYKKAESRAELGVCAMPPTDEACETARQEEIDAIRVLHAELHEVVHQLIVSAPGGLVGDIRKPPPERASQVATLLKLANLIHLQAAPDTLSQEAWRTLNAVSAVVWKQTLQRAEAEAAGGVGDAGAYHDILLHHSSGHLLYIGAFNGLRFHGQGCLYRRHSSLAYCGGWRHGVMDGEGTLLDHQGNLLWKGQFEQGAPARPWYSL